MDIPLVNFHSYLISLSFSVLHWPCTLRISGLSWAFDERYLLAFVVISWQLRSVSGSDAAVSWAFGEWQAGGKYESDGKCMKADGGWFDARAMLASGREVAGSCKFYARFCPFMPGRCYEEVNIWQISGQKLEKTGEDASLEGMKSHYQASVD